MRPSVLLSHMIRLSDAVVMYDKATKFYCHMIRSLDAIVMYDKATYNQAIVILSHMIRPSVILLKNDIVKGIGVRPSVMLSQDLSISDIY